MRRKNQAVAAVLRDEVVYRHCIHAMLCDTYWVSPSLVDVAALNRSIEELSPDARRSKLLLRDRMGSHIVRNNQRCTHSSARKPW